MHKPKAWIFLLVTVSLQVASACNSDYTIRQKGYYRIELPSHRYQQFDKPGYPYRFEYPVYANVVQDTSFFEDKPENPYWINIDFPSLHGKIYISYKAITSGKAGSGPGSNQSGGAPASKAPGQPGKGPTAGVNISASGQFDK